MGNLSSPTRNQTCGPCIEGVESQPLDHQGNPKGVFFFYSFKIKHIEKQLIIENTPILKVQSESWQVYMPR